MANRHLSRSIVLQTLFEWDFQPAGRQGNNQPDDIGDRLDRNIEEFGPGLEEGDQAFMHSLTDLVLKKRTVVDEIIQRAAPQWPIDKISAVDRNVLRIGLTELLFGDRAQVPPKVAINESIEMAKTFGGDSSGRFVNGVLGTVYKEIGEPGKEETSKKKVKEEVDPATLPLERLGGAVIYTKKDGEIYLALVHDIFGYWTLSKGGITDNEDCVTDEACTEREIKEELGLEVKVKEKLGENEYVATHPEKGRRRKHVNYFLAEATYAELKLNETKGLDEARWFKLSEIADLKIYNDIVPIITKAIEIITK